LELIERFLIWLSEDPDRETKSVFAKKKKKPALLEAARELRQITQRSLPSPYRLAEIAARYEAKQLRESNAQYEAFMNSGYPNFVEWMESLVEKSALFGGGFLLLTFDNSSGIVTAATPGPREILLPTSYALPLSQSAVQKLAATAAHHFQKADFVVRVSRQETSALRTGAHFTPAYDCLDIVWTQN
jgi:hypothetical protein